MIRLQGVNQARALGEGSQEVRMGMESHLRTEATLR